MSRGPTEFSDSGNQYIIKSGGLIQRLSRTLGSSSFAEALPLKFFIFTYWWNKEGDAITLKVDYFSTLKVTTETTQSRYQVALATEEINIF